MENNDGRRIDTEIEKKIDRPIWKPIKTCPTDGTLFLIKTDLGTEDVGFAYNPGEPQLLGGNGGYSKIVLWAEIIWPLSLESE